MGSGVAAVCRVLCVLVMSLAGLGAGAEEPAAGTVSFLRGEATRRTTDGREMPLALGSAVYDGDLVDTRRRTLLTLTFTDNTRFSLGSNASLLVEQVHSGQDATFNAQVLRGAFRFITGLIAKVRPAAMRVRVGTIATIGIRGTTVGGEVEAETATVVLLEPEGEAKSSVVEVGNQYGQVALTEVGTGTRIPNATSPPSPPARMRLRAVDNLVRNLNQLQRLSVPRPVLH